MKTTLRQITCLAVVAALSLGFASSAFAAAGRWDAAVVHLEAAKAEMQKAASRGGKKEDALQKLDEVIALLKTDSEAIKEKVEAAQAKKKKN